MIIKRLELVNFQVISKFNADFEGNVYFITGDNELGKSTVLKAIGALLTGARDAVLKNGENKGFARMVIGDDGEEYKVELRYTKSNPRGTLSITQNSSGRRSDNVSMLQKILGYTDFDAVEFSRWSETAEGRRKQIEVVKSLLPEKVRKRIAEIDSEVIDLKDKRLFSNRELKQYNVLCAEAENNLSPGDVEKFTVPKDITTLMQEQQVAAQLIEKAKTVRASREQRIIQLSAIPERIKQVDEDYLNKIGNIKSRLIEARKAYEEKLALAEKAYKEAQDMLTEDSKQVETDKANQLKSIEEERADLERRKANADKWLEEYEKDNPEKLDTAERLKAAEEYNKKCRIVSEYKEKVRLRDSVAKDVDAMEKRLEKLASERENLISDSKLPIPGLSFTNEGLELNGVPFIAGKVSDSQIMEVAAKLIIASNPTVKVFRIARGESLGQNRLQAIINIAKENGFQGFIEEVKRGQDELIIEEYTENE
jgi:DNA repair exonuclease SbcCD ATPase subunit